MKFCGYKVKALTNVPVTQIAILRAKKYTWVYTPTEIAYTSLCSTEGQYRFIRDHYFVFDSQYTQDGFIIYIAKEYDIDDENGRLCLAVYTNHYNEQNLKIMEDLQSKIKLESIIPTKPLFEV